MCVSVSFSPPLPLSLLLLLWSLTLLFVAFASNHQLVYRNFLSLSLTLFLLAQTNTQCSHTWRNKQYYCTFFFQFICFCIVLHERFVNAFLSFFLPLALSLCFSLHTFVHAYAIVYVYVVVQPKMYSRSHTSKCIYLRK